MNKQQDNVSDKVIKAAKKIFGKTNIKSIESIGARLNKKHIYNKKHKIVVFVPLKNADELTFALASAGAGVIGNYTVCSFRVKGVGTFIGGKGSKPKTGKKGKFEMAEEVRLEMICDKKNLDNVVDKIYGVHPYEEPAYEIYDVTVRAKEVSKKTTSKQTASKEIAFVKLERKITVKSIFNNINNTIDTANLPGSVKNVKFKQAIIDYSPNGLVDIEKAKNKTLYIKRSKNITNIELK